MSEIVGLQPASAFANEYSATRFLVQQMLLQLATAALVRVVSVTNAGELSPVGFVDVQPLVTQVTGSGATLSHGILYRLPYFRLQGGANAIVLDPQAGDIGLAAFSNRDISRVKVAKSESPPDSMRFMDWSDGCYFGGFLNASPTQYVQFTASGITVHSPTKVTVSAPEIDLTATTKVVVSAPEIDINGSAAVSITSPAISLNGAVSQTGGAASTFSGSLAAQGTDLHTHAHTGVTTGVGNTGPPV